MLKLRVREYSPDGVRGRVLPTIDDTISVTIQENGEPSLSFALSTTMAGRMPDDGFSVRVEYAVDDEKFQPIPEHDLFIVTENSGDDAEQSQTVTFTGESYVTFMLRHTYVHWHAQSVNKIRKITGNAGAHLKLFLDESKARGWGANVLYDFTAAKDSAGVSWLAGDSVELEWQLLTTNHEVLNKLVDGGTCDWTVTNNKLRVFRAGTRGVDRTELVLGGPRMERVPVKSDMGHVFTDLTVASDTGYWQYLTTGVVSKWGRLEQTMTMSGVGHMPTAQKLAQPVLAEGKQVKREESFEWTPNAADDLVPWRDFQVGDTVTARARGGKLPRRVIGVVAREQKGGATVRVVVGEKIGTTQSRVLSRLGAGSVGGVIGGTGNSFPGSLGPAAVAPSKPNGLVVSSNTGVWRDDFSAESLISFGWAAVTSAVDGSEVTVTGYELWARSAAGVLTYVTEVSATATPTVTVTSFTPGELVLVAVRAKSEQGVFSEFSLEIPVTPVMPGSVVPKAPGVVTVASNVGAFTAAGPVAQVTLNIPVVTKSTDNEDIEIAEYELWDANGPLMRVPASPAKVTLPTGGAAVYRVRACSAHGVWGDLSVASATVVGAAPAVQSGKNPTGVSSRTGFGVVVTEWAGTYASAPSTDSVLNVRVEARVGTVGAWIMQGTLGAAGSVTLQLGAVGDTVQSRLVAYDRMNRVIGTSATASVVVNGIDFTDFDGLTQERIEGIENDQIVIGRTVDGLNRTFTSVESPGRGYIGHHNLAPSLFGATTPVEVRRNVALNPLGAGAGGFLTNNGTIHTRTVNVAVPAPHPQGITTCARSVLKAGQANSDVLSFYNIDGLANTRAASKVGAWFFVDADGYQCRVGVTGAYRPLPKNTWVWCVSETIAENSFTSASIRKISGNASESDSGYITGVTEIVGIDPVETLAPGATLLLTSNPEDFTTSWVGTPNASPTILTGLHPTGFTDVNCVSIIHEVGDGTRELRQIPTIASDNSYTSYNIPATSTLRADGTSMATLCLPAPQTGTLNFYARSVWADGPSQITPRSPNVAGTYQHRLHYTNLTSTYRTYLFSGGAAGSGDVYWSNIGLFAGELPEDAEKIHQGDVWYRLETIAGDLVIAQVLIWNGDDWTPYELWVDSLAAANSVTARLIKADEAFFTKVFTDALMAGRIMVDHLAPNVGENLNLSANGSIILIAGQQQELSSEISSVVSDITTVDAKATAAANAAAAAQSAANIADGKALVAQTTASNVADGLSAQQAVFVVTSDGAEVRSKDGTNVTRIEPSEISMLQGGVKLFRVKDSQVIANELVSNRAQIGNHVIEKSGTRTVFRTI